MTGQLYSGLPANIATVATVNISGTNNANPIQVTTAAPHNLRTGDWVNIRGHVTQTSANCVNKVVTVLDATNFTIPIDGTGNAPGGATGVVVGRSYTGNVATLPADGDAYAAATYVPGYAASLDRDAFVRAAGLGKWMLVDVLNFDLAGASLSFQWAYRVGAPIGNVWTELTTDGTLAGPPVTWQVPEAAIGDMFECQLDTSWAISGGGAGYTPQVGIAWAVATYGNTPNHAAYLTNVPTGDKTFTLPVGIQCNVPVTLKAMIGLSGNNTNITYSGTNTVGQLFMQPWIQGQGVSSTVSLIGNYQFQVKQYRQTGVII
jgi:hypothetical protein